MAEPCEKRRKVKEMNPLASYLMDLRCSICLTTLYQDLTLGCPSNTSCLKGGHLLCENCHETFTAKNSYCKCPICKEYVSSLSKLSPYIPSGLQEVMSEGLNQLEVHCKSCETHFEGREAYLDHLNCPTCGLGFASCDPEAIKAHSCKVQIKAKLTEMEEWWSAKCKRIKKDFEEKRSIYRNRIEGLEELLRENDIEFEEE